MYLPNDRRMRLNQPRYGWPTLGSGCTILLLSFLPKDLLMIAFGSWARVHYF
jgi:hypothetical protein